VLATPRYGRGWTISSTLRRSRLTTFHLRPSFQRVTERGANLILVRVL
jgi:hypothetical protein